MVVATLADDGRPPAHLGVTHWSARLLAAELGIGFASVARIWRKWDLQPWRAETFKFSTDPELDAKIRDVVGLYLDPPEKAVVLCIDEKSQIQALDRTAPILPIRPGLPEKATHDYVRHGTTTLFAALEVATGRVEQACLPRHRHQEFLAFLKQVAKAYPRESCTSCATTTPPTSTPPSRRGWPQPPDHPALHPDVGVVAEHGRDLLRDHHPPGHPPRHLQLRPRPDRGDQRIHQRLERTLPTVHLDQERRHDHRKGTP